MVFDDFCCGFVVIFGDFVAFWVVLGWFWLFFVIFVVVLVWFLVVLAVDGLRDLILCMFLFWKPKSPLKLPLKFPLKSSPSKVAP